MRRKVFSLRAVFPFRFTQAGVSAKSEQKTVKSKRQTKSEQIASKERKKKNSKISAKTLLREKKKIGAVSGVRNGKKDTGRKTPEEREDPTDEHRHFQAVPVL